MSEAFPTVIKCPRCGQRHSSIIAESLFRATTRCVAPGCNVSFSIHSRKDAVGDAYRVIVGFTPADKERNKFTDHAERVELDKLPLAELVKAGSDMEDFYSTLIAFYEEKSERLYAYIRGKRRAMEATIHENQVARAERQRITPIKAAPPPPKEAGKRAVAPAVVNVAAYRTQVLTIIDTWVAVGKYTPSEGQSLRTDAVSCEEGLWRVAKKLGLPVFER